MILVAVLLLSLVIALLRGGKLMRLGQVSLRGAWLIPLAFLMQVYVAFVPARQAQGRFDPAALLNIGSYMMLLVAVVLNRRLPGMALIGMGLLLNAAVITANGGFMPIEPHIVRRLGHEDRVQALDSGNRVYQAKDVVLPREGTRLWLLSDIFLIPPPFPLRSALSLGDAFLAAGMFVFLQRTLVLSSQQAATRGT